MSREILFRGKRTDNGEWVEGYFIKTKLGKDTSPSDVVFVPWKENRNEEKENRNEEWGWIKVDPDTLCQYTGLTDKNGKKIWENDIIKTSKYGKDDGKGSNIAGFDIFSVQWDDGGFALYSKWRRFNLRDNNGYEVIGNIFDNPELLEG